VKDSDQMELLGLTLSPPDSPVRTSQPPGKEQELKVSGQDSGQKSPVLLANYDPDTSSWKTSQRCLVEGWTRYSETWPRSGTMQNGIAFQLPTLAHRTVGIGGGAYATPTTMDSLPPKSPEALEREATIARPGRSRPANLRDQISNSHLWPTPQAKESGKKLTNYDHKKNRYLTKDGHDYGMGLTQAVHDPKYQQMWPTPTNQSPRKMMPTPTASDHIERTSTSTEAVNPLTGKSVSLDRFVKFWPDQETQESGVPQMWPTPTSRDYKDGSAKSCQNVPENGLLGRVATRGTSEGSLNPTWVSWLMGYPLDWLDLDGFQNPELEELPPEYLTEPPD